MDKVRLFLSYVKNKKGVEFKMKNNKGITLIALIITIIVMLILVAVSVNILIESNLIGTAGKATNKYKTATEEEANGGTIEINGKKYNSIDDYMEEINPTIVEGKPEDWEYTVESDETITITGYLNKDKTIDTVIVPNRIGGIPVKKIKGSIYGVTEGTSIWNENICDGTERIAECAESPKNITIKKIVISTGIEDIENGAFTLTKNLEEVILPSTISNLGDFCFYRLCQFSGSSNPKWCYQYRTLCFP